MSIKVINHRRRLIRKNKFYAPHKRHNREKLILTKSEKIKINKEKKLSNKNRLKNKTKPKKKAKPIGLKMPYRFKYYQFQDYNFKNHHLENLSKELED